MTRFDFRPEMLLTADEATAILLSNTSANGNADTVAFSEESADHEAEARREAEALAVLLSDSEGGGGGVPGGEAAESALTRLAARYLLRETVRGKIPDPVGNFHVRASLIEGS